MNKYLLSNINLLMRSDLTFTRITKNMKIIVKNEKLLLDRTNSVEAKLEAFAKALGVGFETKLIYRDQAPPKERIICVKLNTKKCLSPNIKKRLSY
jgi:hypothetical protein